MIELSLPWPPSVNTYWRHPTRGPLAGRHLISEQGRRYREQVALELGRVNVRHAYEASARLAVSVLAYPPDKRRRDLDNLLKAILDSLTYAKVIDDDSQFDCITIWRKPPVRDGKVEILIIDYESE